MSRSSAVAPSERLVRRFSDEFSAMKLTRSQSRRQEAAGWR
jgi:hypothetical protein